MPYLYAHALHGCLAERRQNEALRAMLARQFDAFTLGLYGPDVYFGDTLPKPLLRKNRRYLAGMLHGADMGALFSALLPLAAGDERAFAYALGFLCHAVLDNNMHPYICSQYAGNDHTRFEMRQDLPLRDRFDEPRVKVSPGVLYDTGRAVATADALHAVLFAAVFPAERATGGAYRRSYPKWQRIQRMAYDPKGKKLRIVKRVEKALHKEGVLSGYLLTYDPDDTRDLFNERRTPFAPPWDETDVREETYFERFDLAVDEAASLLACAWAERENGSFSGTLRRIGCRRMCGEDAL